MSKISAFNKFAVNEDTNGDITITMDDVRTLNHNLGDDFIKNYGWKEDQTLVLASDQRYRSKKNITVCDIFYFHHNIVYL